MSAIKTRTAKKTGKNRLGKARNLTVRQAAVVAGLLEGKTAQNALLDAGYSASTARTQSRDVIEPLQETLQASMRRTGWGPDKFKRHLQRLLRAKKPQGPDGDLHDDNQAITNALRIWVDVAGLEAPKQHEHTGTLDINVRREEQATLWEKLGGIS